jgi:hypothetical protein
MARSWVLSPISARATSATEVRKASKGVIFARYGTNVGAIHACSPHCQLPFALRNEERLRNDTDRAFQVVSSKKSIGKRPGSECGRRLTAIVSTGPQFARWAIGRRWPEN